MFKFIFILSLFIFPNITLADLPQNYKRLMDQYGFNESTFGFVIQNLSEKDISPIKHNIEKPFNTASLVKILTTYLAIKDLGPSFRWQSNFYHTGRINKEVLEGDLIFRGGADASFSIYYLEKMLIDLRSKGIKKIKGNLVLDYSFFGEMPLKKDFDDSPLRAYNVLPSAISLQSNTINFKIIVEKNKIKIKSDPNLDSLVIVNNLRLSNSKCGNWKSRMKFSVSKKDQKNIITFRGGFAKRCSKKEIDLAVMDKSQFFYEIFKTLWIKHGGIIEGGYRKEYNSIHNKVYLNHHSSKPLSELIRDTNKFSLNLMARNLLLTTIKGDKDSIKPNENMTNQFINNWFEKEGFLNEGLFVDNGAGLSRKTQININQLLQILQRIYNDPYMPEMIASLPIASIDGTLKNKMKATKISRYGHFKTGSLKNVVGIAGFFLNKNKDMNAFIFVMNDNDAKNAQPFIEDLINLSF